MRASLAALGLLALLLSLAPPSVQCDDGPFSLADGGSLVVLDENHMEVPQNNDGCATQPCGLAAICTPTGPDTRTCSCPDNSGLILHPEGHCLALHRPDVCERNPCGGGAVCTPSGPDSRTCACPSDGRGLVMNADGNCARPPPPDPCQLTPCGTGAVCTPAGPDSRTCACPTDSRRLALDAAGNCVPFQRTAPCVSRPCGRAATCVPTGPDSRICTCPANTPLILDTLLNCVPSVALGRARDRTPPVIAVPADVTANATGPAGAAVFFEATGFDTVDGSLFPVCAPASGSLFRLDLTTTVLCTVADAAGNTASGSFTVTIVDLVPPLITAPASVTAEATGELTAVTFTVTALDLVDGPVTPTCTPASGTAFTLGSVTVSCTAVDAKGNAASATFPVTVVDTTPPSFVAPAVITVEATGPLGANVTWNAGRLSSFNVTASDLVDGPVAVTCNETSGARLYPVDSDTAIQCNASDSRGNAGSVTVTVRVRDTTPPRIILNGLPPRLGPYASDVMQAFSDADPPFALNFVNAVWVFVFDAVDLVISDYARVMCRPGYEQGITDLFDYGIYRINCTAVDNHGNRAERIWYFVFTCRPLVFTSDGQRPTVGVRFTEEGYNGRGAYPVGGTISWRSGSDTDPVPQTNFKALQMSYSHQPPLPFADLSPWKAPLRGDTVSNTKLWSVTIPPGTWINSLVVYGRQNQTVGLRFVAEDGSSYVVGAPAGDYSETIDADTVFVRNPEFISPCMTTAEGVRKRVRIDYFAFVVANHGTAAGFIDKVQVTFAWYP